MIVLTSSLLLSVLLLPEQIRSYPFGAGACLPDGPSVMGPHLSGGEQAEFDDLYSVLINGSVMLTDSTAFLQGETYEITVIASSQMFKGALIRVQGSGVLEPGSLAKEASGCGDDAEGITHVGSDEKSDLSGFYSVGTSDSEIKIDVTIVESLAKYAHKQFVVSVEQAVIETVESPTTPAPVEPLPMTAAPMEPLQMTPAPMQPLQLQMTPAPVAPLPMAPSPSTSSPISITPTLTTPGPTTETPAISSPTTASPTSLPPFETRAAMTIPPVLTPVPTSMAPLSIVTNSPITMSTPVPVTSPIPVTTNPPVSIQLIAPTTEPPSVIFPPVFLTAPPANIIPISWIPPSSFTTTPPTSFMMGPTTSFMTAPPTSFMMGPTPPSSFTTTPPTSSMMGPTAGFMTTPPTSFMMGPTTSFMTTPPVADDTPIFTTTTTDSPSMPILPLSTAPPSPVNVPFPTIPLLWTPAPGGSSSTFDALASGSANLPLRVSAALALSSWLVLACCA